MAAEFIFGRNIAPPMLVIFDDDQGIVRGSKIMWREVEGVWQVTAVGKEDDFGRKAFQIERIDGDMIPLGGST